MPKWLDDSSDDDKVVSAEQHALDNVGHAVTVQVTEVTAEFHMLNLTCSYLTCGWWDEQAVLNDPPVELKDEDFNPNSVYGQLTPEQIKRLDTY